MSESKSPASKSPAIDLTGKVALIRIRDTQKRNHYYSFILLGMQDYISELSACYNTPKPPPEQ